MVPFVHISLKRYLVLIALVGGTGSAPHSHRRNQRRRSPLFPRSVDRECPPWPRRRGAPLSVRTLHCNARQSSDGTQYPASASIDSLHRRTAPRSRRLL